VLLPKAERRIPILIAGNKPRMLRLTARYAEAWNTAWFWEPNQKLHDRLAAFDETLAAEGRELTAVEVDWMLWGYSQGLFPVRPHHRVRTVFY